MNKRNSYILYFIFLNCLSYGQSSTELLQDGDRQYGNKDFIAAEELYRKAGQEENSLASIYNLGNATYNQERYEEAIEHYLNATRRTNDKSENSNIYYNLGNAYFNNQKLDEAIEAYKQAIRLDPSNEEARYNLAYSKEMKKMLQQQQQDQQQNSDQPQENQEQQDQDQQQNENQENSDQQDQQNQQENQESQQDSTNQQQSEGGTFDSTRLEKQTLDSLDAAKLLQIIQAEEQKVQEKLRKYNSNRKKPDKDW